MVGMFVSQVLLSFYVFLDLIFGKVFFLVLPKCSIERVRVVCIFGRGGGIFLRTGTEKKFSFYAVNFSLKPLEFLCS